MLASKPDQRRAILKSIRTLTEHPALRTTLLIGSGGIALMLANVLYAKLLDAEGFGRLVLMQAIAFVAMGLLPMGFENLVARREISAPLPIIYRVLAIGLGLAAVLLGLVYWFIDDNLELLLYVFFAGSAGAATRLFAAIEQSEMRFLRSQVISQAPPVIFLCCAVTHSVFGLSTWESGATTYVSSFVLGALVGYLMVRRTDSPAGRTTIRREHWFRAFALIGILASILLLNQMGLFIAAGVLGMREVGALGLATTLIASPFRLLSHGVGYTLIPRMAACEESAERRKLLLHEFFVAMGVGVPGAVALFLLVPPFVNMLFGDEYLITRPLNIALITLGLIRLNTAVVSAAINALAGTESLHIFNLTGWVSAAVAAAAAFLLSGFGATGIVAGVAIGWIVRIAFASVLIRKEL